MEPNVHARDRLALMRSCVRSTRGALPVLDRWVSPSRLPNPACLLPGTGLSASPVGFRWWFSSRGLAMGSVWLLPGSGSAWCRILAGLNRSISDVVGHHPPLQ